MKKKEFEYGYFEYAKLDKDPSLVKGKFHLNINPKFYNDFNEEFILYNFDQIDDIIEKNKDNYSFHNKIVNFGPYYPKTRYDEDIMLCESLKFPTYSQFLLKTKSRYIDKAKNQGKTYSYDGRIETLKIFSNLFSTIINQNFREKHINYIIPVPAKSIYSLNSVSIICEELSKLLGIPINNQILERISDEDSKKYRAIKTYNWWEQISVILVDDIITDGTTKINILNQLQNSNVTVEYIITLGKTDYNKAILL